MRTFFLTALFLVSFSIQSQERIEQKLGYFATLKVFDGLSVKLIKAKENKVAIYGENAQDVKAVTSAGKLKLRMKTKRAFKGYNTFVDVYYTELDVIDVNEEAMISSDEVFNSLDMIIRAQEGGEINVKVAVEKLVAKAITAGKIYINGTAEVQEISIGTGGQFMGKDLISKQTQVTVSAGGTASVNAKRLVVAKVRAGGTINIYGNPARIDKQKFVGGKIIEKN